MPLGPGVRYRVKQTSKGPLRLAFQGNKVVETKNMKTGKVSMVDRLAEMKTKGKFKKGKGKPKFGGKKY